MFNWALNTPLQPMNVLSGKNTIDQQRVQEFTKKKTAVATTSNSKFKRNSCPTQSENSQEKAVHV